MKKIFWWMSAWEVRTYNIEKNERKSTTIDKKKIVAQDILLFCLVLTTTHIKQAIQFNWKQRVLRIRHCWYNRMKYTTRYKRMFRIIMSTWIRQLNRPGYSTINSLYRRDEVVSIPGQFVRILRQVIMLKISMWTYRFYELKSWDSCQ